MFITDKRKINESIALNAKKRRIQAVDNMKWIITWSK